MSHYAYFFPHEILSSRTLEICEVVSGAYLQKSKPLKANGLLFIFIFIKFQSFPPVDWSTNYMNFP